MTMSALAAPATDHRAPLSTTLDTFGACFVQRQEQDGRPWAFVPTKSGGTFTNVGASAGTRPYQLLARVGQGEHALRLIAEVPSAELLAAVEKCR